MRGSRGSRAGAAEAELQQRDTPSAIDDEHPKVTRGAAEPVGQPAAERPRQRADQRPEQREWSGLTAGTAS